MTATALSLDQVRDVVAAALHPAHFYARSGTLLRLQHDPAEELSWEIHKGRLLDPSQTRLQRTFLAWNLFLSDETSAGAEPLLSIKLDPAAQQLHVVRSIYCYAWEGYHAGNNVYDSREVRKWVRELVGTISVDQVHSIEDVRDEIHCLLFQAVTGSSRLPITSIEAPLPAFSLGELAYFFRPDVEKQPAAAQPLSSYRQVIEKVLNDLSTEVERARLVEVILRGVTAREIGAAAALFSERWTMLGLQSRELMALFRRLFNEVALSPYTGFVDNMLLFLEALVAEHRLSSAQHVDLLSYFLRQTSRHLTAYDLVTFHHRGANYPDALLLDAVLRNYLTLIERMPELFVSLSEADDLPRRRRRRGLRQGWLMWHLIQGLPVPDAPTSPGENARILPPPHFRVPEEQILVPAKRTKRLFAGQSLEPTGSPVAKLLFQSIEDLRNPQELQELGMAVFLERPLAIGKAPGEPDRTLLLSHEAFSRSIAGSRLQCLADRLSLVSDALHMTLRESLESLPAASGLAIPAGRRPERPGSVSLSDAAKVADDFRLLQTTRQTVQQFLEQFDFTGLASLECLNSKHPMLIVPDSSSQTGMGEVLRIYDAAFRPRVELQVDLSLGYLMRKGKEVPRAGLHVVRTWQTSSDGALKEEHGSDVRVLPRI
jgi:hypothetical protein